MVSKLKMSDLDQQILKFNFKKSYEKEDYFVSKSNYFAFSLIDMWPRWEKKFVNICGEKYSGKSHLVEIFLKKNKGKLIDLKKNDLNEIDKFRVFENIIIENFDDNYNERDMFSLINFVDQNNKYLLVVSEKPINEFNFSLKDLESRSKNCLIAKIGQPDDELIRVLLSKSFSDKQILINNKLIDYMLKRIPRSYGKIFEFIYKIDEISLKKKKSIDLKTIKNVLKV
tara:strand:- start:697 stop:1377 length:681 start_codon:yes stop_codon:yes gene_type:complete